MDRPIVRLEPAAGEAPARGDHDVHFQLAYGGGDAELIAERAGVSLSDEETAVIVDRIDGELGSLALRATEEAVHARIAELVRVVGCAHDVSDDD